ncbi:MAG: succinyldiaminopimelate transaminase [Betaproteobacteria bacterium RIFCSPLOWO2_12_FULL_63_13]|nr:MAG: succinyldiaminopimelate transaminase [Betaproteobacteria bacterium RIFCSPLOWO2_02_FULL_63_19]OGA54197.1 MAG: succinyldiaminopimelate transaminase [Betaproteobacteria bacterium RIFCSPLOWO2_12_FULL_63_13]
MNPNLARLQPYPFERLRALYEGIEPNTKLSPINLSIGEPKHATPAFIERTLADNLNGLSIYPPTLGSLELREAIASWLVRRHGLATIDATTQVLPVNGSREALFAFAQAVIDPSRGEPFVICPNPFYQIYEGSALLAGAAPYFVNMTAANGFAADYQSVPEHVWKRTQLLYACSPSNPTGRVMNLDEWSRLFELSDRYGFVIASDECYSELYFREDQPALGALAAANRLGRGRFARLVVFSSLSKRSNVPGMRSGFVAGDAALLKSFLLYRTYHGSAMSPAVQAASAAAWKDETHVRENRRLYAEKFKATLGLIEPPLAAAMPDGGFYYWMRTPMGATEFAGGLYRDCNVQVLPGSFLARQAQGVNPGAGYIRVALVAPLAECIEAVERINLFSRRLKSS